MEYRGLGNTDLKVSVICLGTMTWGEQNSEEEAHLQMDMALDKGVNFFDTAEMYPVPPKQETQGKTESYIGSWFRKNNNRSKIILATKVTGRSPNFNYIRGSETRLNNEHITKALEASLKRLNTDYIDLYQLHWPERQVNNFSQLNYTHKPREDDIELEETLGILQDFIRRGKIRHIGISNETPWGMHECLKLAETKKLPRVVSIQNPYNLLNRSFEIGLAEIALRENCGLLAYSPLAFGVLTGKYLSGKAPHGSRLTIYTRFGRYNGAKGQLATVRYVEIAEKHGLNPAQMSLAFVNAQPFVTSTIIGATNLEQLRTNIDSMNIKLSTEVLNDIQNIFNEIPNPCP